MEEELAAVPEFLVLYQSLPCFAWSALRRIARSTSIWTSYLVKSVGEGQKDSAKGCDVSEKTGFPGYPQQQQFARGRRSDMINTSSVGAHNNLRISAFSWCGKRQVKPVKTAQTCTK